MSTRGALLLALVAACSHPDPRVDGWRADLHALADTIAAHHKDAFFHVAEPTWRKQVAELDAQLPRLDEAHFLAGLERLVAAIGDAHTKLFLPRDRVYPLQFLWFDDGLFVGGAGPSNAWAIGKRVVSVGSASIDDAIGRLADLVPHENDAGLRNEMPALLSDPIALAGTDLASRDTATFTLIDGAAPRALTVTADTGVALALPRVLPLHLQGPTQLAYWNKYVEDQRLIYFQYNACADDAREETFARFAEGTLAFADQHPVDRFVIDLRSNLGGNSTVIEPLVTGLVARPALAGRVFVLIGRTTFSSAVMNASELASRVGATLVGTPTGGNPNGFAEVVQFELPSSHLHGQYSTKLYSDARYRGNTIPPDVLVHVTSADWFSGRDPALDAVLAAPVPAR